MKISSKKRRKASFYIKINLKVEQDGNRISPVLYPPLSD